MGWGIKLGFIAVAVLIIVGIIWDSRRHRVRNKRRHREPRLQISREPEAGAWEDVVIVKKPISRAPLETDVQSARMEQIPQQVISFSVMAPLGQVFEGQAIRAVAESLNLVLGDRHIFHRHENADGTGPKLFSMASAVKPGTFEVETLDQFTTPGLTLFLMQTLPGKSMVAFEVMLRTARHLAQNLGGELWDEQRKALSTETVENHRVRLRAVNQPHMEMHV